MRGYPAPERSKPRRRGAPLLLLGLLLIGWVSVRAAVWQNPFPDRFPPASRAPIDVAAQAGDGASREARASPKGFAELTLPPSGSLAEMQAPPLIGREARRGQNQGLSVFGPQTSVSILHPQHPSNGTSAAEEQGMVSNGAVEKRNQLANGGGGLRSEGQRAVGVPRAAPPAFDDGSNSASTAAVDRWSFDAFSFYRAGSGSESVSAGRVAVYGASQSSARLQYRFAPSSRRDPRAFVRAYQAHVSGGESEVATGLSLRPLPSLPVRAYGELRLTDTALFGTTVRPAAYAVTEIAPVSLPFDVAMELYGGAGYVGGKAPTFFADGQAVAMRSVAKVKAIGQQAVKVSVGGGVWGGVQRDAGRVDVGPSLRFDFDVGDVPARVSIDWRERVAGDAKPDSGVAATLSTRF